MRHDHVALGDLRRDARQGAGDVFVRESVEAVAAHPLLVEGIRQRVVICHVGMRTVERGIEAGDLQDARKPLLDGAHRSQVLGLVEWCQRHEAFERGEHSVVHGQR